MNSEQNGENHPRLASIDSLQNSESDRRSSIPRNRSYDNMATSSEANVLVIYTGGTIGMTRNSNNGMSFRIICSFFFISFTLFRKFRRLKKSVTHRRKGVKNVSVKKLSLKSCLSSQLSNHMLSRIRVE